jgi:hypothetical protein
MDLGADVNEDEVVRTIATYIAMKGVDTLVSGELKALYEKARAKAIANSTRIWDRAKEFAGTVTNGPTPRAVMELVQSGSLIDDPDIQDMFARLLAREMQGGEVHPSFPSLVASLSPEEARLFKQIAQPDGMPILFQFLKHPVEPHITVRAYSHPIGRRTHERLMALRLVFNRTPRGDEINDPALQAFGRGLGMVWPDFYILSLDDYGEMFAEAVLGDIQKASRGYR